MSSPAVARLGHVALETPDLAESVEFFRDGVGLEEVEREGDTVYLRAVDEWDHHSLSLTEADAAGVDHVGWQTEDRESLDGFAEILEEEGREVTWVDAGTEAGQGEAIRFEAPNGHPFELYAQMDKPEPPEERKSKLKNRVYSTDGNNAIAPYRNDHLQLWDPDAEACVEWLQDTLGFQLQEYYDQPDGTRWGTFLSATGVKIDLAVVQLPEDDDRPGIHHAAYKVDDANDLYAAKDVMNELGYPTDGLGQHGISRGKFLYARDPASGHRIEFNAGGYFTFDPHWEPVAWEEGDISDGDDHQWLGRIESTERVQH